MSKDTQDLKRFYWDANIFLTLINEEPAERLPILQAIFDDCDGQNTEIYTSILSITEVAWAESEKKERLLNASKEERIEKLWTPPSPIKLVDIHQFITYDAKTLMRQAITKGWSLKPADAIHLATAKRMELDEIHTYDPSLNKFSELTGIKIREPHTERLAFSGPINEEKKNNQIQ